MGREVEAAARAQGHEVTAVLDDAAGATRGSLQDADVAVDFTTPDAALGIIERASGLGLDLVVGTTGWYNRLDDARAVVDRAGTGLVWAPNFSLGVQIFVRVAREAGRLVDGLEEYDVSVHETHHRHKVDHPSGTAIRIADVLVETVRRKARWQAGPPDGKPDADVLWVSSSRVGEVPGTHVVSLEGPDDAVELRHIARGRSGFARGAVSAASWIRGRKGFYGIEDMLAERFGALD
jgi:4-hydroxy-tetrahydrodipicolinate reductase